MSGILLALLLTGYSSILPVNGFLSSLECGHNSLVFGGRLRLPPATGLDSQWDGSKKFIFLIPGMKRPQHRYNGRGRIFVTSTAQSCDSLPRGHCPTNDAFPCMSSKTPCSIGPPEFKDKTPLTFSELTSDGVTVTIPEWNHDVGNGEGPVTTWILWSRSEDGKFQNFTKDISDTSHRLNLQSGVRYEMRMALVDERGVVGPLSEWQEVITRCLDDIQVTTTSLNRRYARLVTNWWIGAGVCRGINNQTIRFKQLDRDGCTNETDLFNQLDVLLPTDRRHQQRKLNPNSLFRVEVTIVTGSGEKKKISTTKRTQMTAPTAAPVVYEPSRRRDEILFKWSKLSCGERNSDVIIYEYVLTTSNGEPLGARTPAKLVLFKSLTVGDTYSFKVRAVSRFGYGEYSQPKNGTF